MTYYSFDYPKFNVKKNDKKSDTLHIVDYITQNSYNDSYLGKHARDVGHGKYGPVIAVLERLLDANWEVAIKSGTKSIFKKSSRGQSFMDSVCIKQHTCNRYTLEKIRMEGSVATLILMYGDSVEWTLVIDMDSVSEIVSNKIPVKFKKKPDMILGTVAITPSEEVGRFKVEMEVEDFRLLDGVADYSDKKKYKENKEHLITLPGLYSNAYGSWKNLDVIYGVKGLAMAMHVRHKTQDLTFPQEMSDVFYDGIDANYIFGMNGEDIALVSSRAYTEAMDSLMDQISKP